MPVAMSDRLDPRPKIGNLDRLIEERCAHARCGRVQPDAGEGLPGREPVANRVTVGPEAREHWRGFHEFAVGIDDWKCAGAIGEQVQCAVVLMESPRLGVVRRRLQDCVLDRDT